MKLPQGSFAKRALLVGLIAGSGLLGVSAIAATTGEPAAKPGCEAGHGKMMEGKWEAKRAAHQAELKEKLQLKPAQAAAWNAFTQASQSSMQQRHGDRQAMRDTMAKLTAPARMDKMVAMADQRRASLVMRGQAVKAFYAQLTPQQQSVFDAETVQKRAHHEGHHRG